MQNTMCDVPSGENKLIVVMGPTGAGKSSFINLASNSKLKVGGDLFSCTEEIQISETFQLADGSSVTLIDTPGFDDTERSQASVLKQISGFMSGCYERGKQLSGLIYLHRITDIRMSNFALGNFRMFCNLCGDAIMHNVIILTVMWDQVTRAVGVERERQLRERFFKPAIDQGARMMRHLNTADSARNVLVRLSRSIPVPLQIQYEIVDDRKILPETVAGQELKEDFEAKLEALEKQISELKATIANTEAAYEDMRIRCEDAEAAREAAEAAREAAEAALKKAEADLQARFEEVSEANKHLQSTDSAREEQVNADKEANFKGFFGRLLNACLLRGGRRG